ncbi:hypothetical protein SAMN04488029_2227 [Reichenbachiella faecimaris]|uniref:Pyridoxamine 5'-phosphate oxidase n=1 Tax=Reichenbachiella faecimaris TaxID=692418 RepID=A0A1W2GF38_REIFA|nr:hypothetical protein [Reichenbachiella faecimaris]SMD34876.1 hypothetical protein SAMN04488029_2227 [Reichenbachiella faecimaris]
MNLTNDWSKIRKHFNQSFKTNLHVSIGSVDEENNPTVTPIGSLFLNDNQAGFYFEMFPTKLPKHARSNKNICVLGVNSSRWFWVKSLFKRRFDNYPAVKLYGQLGERRKATDKEIARLKRRMRSTKALKGHKYLWGHMDVVREVFFQKGESINLKEMTKGL